MKKMLLTLLTASCLAVAANAIADEYDFVGYDYSDDYKRDYDRGFFIGADAWYTNVRNLHFEPVISSAGGGTIGGRLLDVDWQYDFSPHAEIGYRANRRIGTFTFRYWDFNQQQDRAETGGIFAATGTHPTRGDVVRTSFAAQEDVDVEYAEIEWKHDFGQGRRFTGYWTLALTGWEIEYGTDSMHFNATPGEINSVRVQDFTSTKGFGGMAGVGGRFHFNDRISMGGWAGVGFSSAEQDYLYTDQNMFTGDYLATIQRQDTELNTMTFAGDLNFELRVAGGFELNWGWRYLHFDDAIAKDRFVDTEGKFVTIEQPHGLAFEGPYLGLRYVTGLNKIDADGDGVLDVYDDCPDTPAGAAVDEKGCPRDTDEDGVYDGVDRCPGTPFGTRVDEFGCGVDADGDTVPDGLDLCPNTPTCARVDSKGCPTDGDGDGVPDGCDACPGTSPGRAVDAQGCETRPTDGDRDGDTVPDSRDRCPDTERGAQVDENGCAVVVSMMVHFDSDSAEIHPSDYSLLDRIAAAVARDGGNFEVAGHADAQNTVEYNQRLSERRAEAVKNYLVDHGVDGSHLTSVGYSELRPIATNDTDEGRALNRRVEIVRR
jgi:outer membrane protein OmpA-like peptidoglycan-associated protein